MNETCTARVPFIPANRTAPAPTEPPDPLKIEREAAETVFRYERMRDKGTRFAEDHHFGFWAALTWQNPVRRLERAQREYDYEKDAILSGFERQRAQRDAADREMRLWWQTHHCWLPDRGVASVYQSDFLDWLKAAAKALPNAAARKKLDWMLPNEPFLPWVTLDFLDSGISLTFWAVEDGQIARATFAERFSMESAALVARRVKAGKHKEYSLIAGEGVAALVRQPFSATVEFSALLSLVALYSPERIDFARTRGAAALEMTCGLSRSRLIHRALPLALSGYWLAGSL